MSRLSGIVAIILLSFLAAYGDSPLESVVLVQDRQPMAVIVLPPEPNEREQQAADQIATYIEKISGVRLDMIKDPNGLQTGPLSQPNQAGTRVKILIGSAALAKDGSEQTVGLISTADLEQVKGDRPNTCYEPDGFVLSVQPGCVALAGLRPEGTLYAAVELLERLGCRWLFPGELGEVIPQNQTVAFPVGKSFKAPSFEYRYFWVFGLKKENPDGTMDWLHKDVYDRMEAWYIHSKSSFGTNAEEYGHAIPNAADISDPALLEEWTNKALDFFKENPKVKRFSLGWGDGYCNVGEDLALGIMHPWEKRYSASNPLIAFYNKIVEKVVQAYPDKECGILVYMNYLLPPVRVKPHPALLNVIAPIEQCGRHIGSTGTCWQRDAVLEVVKAWCQMSDKVLLFDYDPVFLVHGSMPVPCARRLKIEYPLMHSFGLRGVLTCAQISVMNQGPNLYVRSKLLWDINTDVDALLDEYYCKLFGPAAQPVRAFWEALEDMMNSRPGHQHEDELMKTVYPIEKVRQLEKYVKSAENKANTEIIRRRVKIIRFCYDNMMRYLQMRQAEDRADFAQAAELAKEMLEHHAEIDAFDPMINQQGSWDRVSPPEILSYMAGGWMRQNQARQACIDGTAGDLVAMLPETWWFKTDPHDEGIIYRWFNPQTTTSGWGDIKVTRIWEVQGLEDKVGHGYDGVVWYRTTFDVAEKFADKPIKLNFGGAFGRMLIWVNGQFVAYRPYELPWWGHTYCENFDFDVRKAIKPGRTNTIVIRLDNQFEWGGIFRRVFLWSPKQTEN